MFPASSLAWQRRINISHVHHAGGGRIVSEVSSFLTAHQHKKGYLVPLKVYTIDENENNKEVKPMNVKSSLLS